MKAVVLKEFGGPENLFLDDLPIPSVEPSAVLIRAVAASANPVDRRRRANASYRIKGAVPERKSPQISQFLPENPEHYLKWVPRKISPYGVMTGV